MPFNVTDFGTNRKLIYDFLLVLNSNLPPIMHHFWDIAIDRSKIAIFGYPWHELEDNQRCISCTASTSIDIHSNKHQQTGTQARWDLMIGYRKLRKDHNSTSSTDIIQHDYLNQYISNNGSKLLPPTKDVNIEFFPYPDIECNNPVKIRISDFIRAAWR